MQMPTTPFAAPHFALRFWLIVAAAPSLHSTDASTSSVVARRAHRRSPEPGGCWRPPRARRSGLGPGRRPALRPLRTDRTEFATRTVGPALPGGALRTLRSGRSDLSGRALRPSKQPVSSSSEASAMNSPNLPTTYSHEFARTLSAVPATVKLRADSDAHSLRAASHPRSRTNVRSGIRTLSSYRTGARFLSGCRLSVKPRTVSRIGHRIATAETPSTAARSDPTGRRR